MPRNPTHALLDRFARLPAGLWLFSRAVCVKAPYFASIRPRFLALEPGLARARMRKRRAVTNHLGTVHAIALCNLCEFVAGTLMAVSIRPDMRWIPRGLSIEYLAKATTDVTAVCAIDEHDWRTRQDVLLTVTCHDAEETIVARATIPMYVSPKQEG